jgi:hypothetical protein
VEWNFPVIFYEPVSMILSSVSQIVPLYSIQLGRATQKEFIFETFRLAV